MRSKTLHGVIMKGIIDNRLWLSVADDVLFPHGPISVEETQTMTAIVYKGHRFSVRENFDEVLRKLDLQVVDSAAELHKPREGWRAKSGDQLGSAGEAPQP
jgi:hypothetical protein